MCWMFGGLWITDPVLHPAMSKMVSPRGAVSIRFLHKSLIFFQIILLLQLNEEIVQNFDVSKNNLEKVKVSFYHFFNLYRYTASNITSKIFLLWLPRKLLTTSKVRVRVKATIILNLEYCIQLISVCVFQPGFRGTQRFRQNISGFRQISEHFFFFINLPLLKKNWRNKVT